MSLDASVCKVLADVRRLRAWRRICLRDRRYEAGLAEILRAVCQGPSVVRSW
jgi:hypothetical protein